MTNHQTEIYSAYDCLRNQRQDRLRVGIILGTGLGSLADQVENKLEVDYEDIPYFPSSTVEGHSGKWIMGTLWGVPVCLMQGRFHVYEGHELWRITLPIRVMKMYGVETLIIGSAVGGLNPQYQASEVVVLEDHINLMGVNPLIGPNLDSQGPRFPDMSEPYSQNLLTKSEEIARKADFKLHRGVYVAVSGPCLETKAEYRHLRQIGADVVGMSTVPEVITAVHAGIKVVAYGAVTDRCLPDALVPTTIDEIIANAEKAAPKIETLIREILSSYGEEP